MSEVREIKTYLTLKAPRNWQIRDNIDMCQFAFRSPAKAGYKTVLLTPRLIPSSSSNSSDPISDILKL